MLFVTLITISTQSRIATTIAITILALFIIAIRTLTLTTIVMQNLKKLVHFYIAILLLASLSIKHLENLT